MKRIITIALLTIGTAFATPTAKTVSAYDEAKRIQLIEWVEQLRVKAGEADKKAQAAQDVLIQSQAELKTANDSLVKLQSDIKLTEDWGKEQQSLYFAADKVAKEQTAIAKKKTTEAHRNAVQRDICVFLFSVACMVLILTCSGQIIAWIIKIYPPAAPYGLLLEIGIAVFSFGAVLGAAEGFLALIYSKL